jgi:hypothetical protein
MSKKSSMTPSGMEPATFRMLQPTALPRASPITHVVRFFLKYFTWIKRMIKLYVMVYEIDLRMKFLLKRNSWKFSNKPKSVSLSVGQLVLARLRYFTRVGGIPRISMPRLHPDSRPRQQSWYKKLNLWINLALGSILTLQKIHAIRI